MAFEAVSIACLLLLFSGLIPDWGVWYCRSLSHRLQTNALLGGHLALSTTPSLLDQQQGLAWAEGGAHQASGLGIPFWRLPFEAAARLLGWDDFPDRLSLGAAMVVFVLSVFRLGRVSGWFAPKEIPANSNRWTTLIEGSGVVLLLVFFPPFINLLKAAEAVYEEVLIYTYLYAIGLVVVLVELVRNTSWGRYWAICLLAGVGGLIRPTLVFYGFATVIVSSFVLVSWRRSRCGDHETKDTHLRSSRIEGGCSPGFRRTAFGWLLFALGGMLLWATNQARFGDGFEFGHRLNVLKGSPEIIYATRFDQPFGDEKLVSAARELFGALFQVKTLNGYDTYRASFFPGQSATVRWRAFYFKTFDLACLGLTMIGWTVTLLLSLSKLTGPQWLDRISAAPSERLESFSLGAWSIGATVPLALFYLRVPCISSRYMMDFAPAFAVAAVLAWRQFFTLRSTGSCMGHARNVALLLTLASWQLWEVTSFQTPNRSLSATWNEISHELRRHENQIRLERAAYSHPSSVKETGLAVNGMDWNTANGSVRGAIVLFIYAPEFLELDLNSPEGQLPASPPIVRAKVGLEFLRQERLTKTADGWKVRFAGPVKAQYRQGIQTLFLAFGPKEALTTEVFQYRLASVRWRWDDPTRSLKPVACLFFGHEGLFLKRCNTIGVPFRGAVAHLGKETRMVFRRF